MLKTIIVLADGREISSGVDSVDAVQSLRFTQSVNDDRELSPGSVCAGMVEVRIITPGGGLCVAAGEEIAVYREDDQGVRHGLGLFTTQQPTRPSANILAITAFDRVSWLDRDLTWWLASLEGWPYRLADFAQLVCDQCGLTLKSQEIPNADHLVQRFSADGITGRQLIRWVGQIAGRFCRATTDGCLEFAWYTAADGICLGPQQTTAEEGSRVLPYFQSGLSLEDYTVQPIEKVQLRQNDEDVGTVFPDTAEVCNTYTVTGNLLLTANLADALVPVAETLYEQLRQVSYTPCRVELPADMEIQAGQILPVIDQNGKGYTMYVMTRTQSGQRDVLECTGSPVRYASGAVNNRSFQAFTGKMLNLRTDVEGLKAENKDAANNLARLELEIQGISTEVSRQQQEAGSWKQTMTQLRQDADSLLLQVQKIEDSGAGKIKTGKGYTFDDRGLWISEDGGEIENRLDHTGMYVTRAGQTLLKANNDGMEAADITVGNYLKVGQHARFEDYTHEADSARTACFFT